MTTEQQKANAIGIILGSILGICLAFLLTWIFNINPEKEYGWFAGLWHGSWAPYNWIRSLIFDDIYVKAPLHTTAYNWFWWIFFIFSLWILLRSVVRLIGLIRMLCK